MVLPEGAPSPESGRQAPWKVGGLITALVVAIGSVLALLNATEPTTQAALTTTSLPASTDALVPPTTSTTTTTLDLANFTVADIATGERLSWFRVPMFLSGWPVDIVSHGGRIWLFATISSTVLQPPGAGLAAWVSPDGIGWKPAGTVASEDFSISAVDTAGDLIVARGSRISDGAPYVWTSSDGEEWTASGLPFDLDEEAPEYRSWLTGLSAIDDRLMVIGLVEPHWQAEIVDRLPPEVGEHVIYDYGLGYTNLADGERRVEVYGPLGLLVYSATLSELGIDPETGLKALDGSPGDTAFMWTSTDGITWSQDRFEDLWVQEMAALPDGTLFVNGGDYRGGGIWVSHDGSQWERVPARTQMRLIGSWRQSLIGISNDRDLVTSDDGYEWESLGTQELLPGFMYWQFDPVAAGEAGLAVIASTWPATHSRQPTAVTINEADASLTFDPMLGVVTIDNGELTVTLPSWSGESSDLAEVDFINEEVAFLHPDSGEVVGRFTFDALHRAESTAFGADPGEHALLLTDSGAQWSILDLSQEIGSEHRVLMMEYFGDQVVMVTTPFDRPLADQPVRFSVRVAKLP